MQSSEISENSIQDLIAGCAKGDPESLKIFFDKYSQDIYNFPLKVFHLTEDDASDFYIYAFEKLKNGKKFKNFEGKSQFKTWFYSVLRNLLIDWKRTKKELKIQEKIKTNSDGVEFGGIESEVDSLSTEKIQAQEASLLFHKELNSVKLEHRVIFKLSYIYYLQLSEEEFQYIIKKSGKTEKELKEWLIRIRSELVEKAQEIEKMEEKLTSLYLSILELKANVQLEKISQPNTNLPFTNRIQKTLEKKYEQRKKILEKKQKGLFVAKTPHKEIAQLLGTSEGNVSVTILRVIKILQKKLKDSEIF